jgi:hypothetical protein
MSFDLAKLDTVAACETPYDLELISPFPGQGRTGMFIQLLGFNSPACRAVKAEQDKAKLMRDFEQRRSGQPEMPTVDDDEESGLQMALAATVGWYERKRDKNGKLGKQEPGLPFGDKRLMFSKDEARKLYSNEGLGWIGGQVIKAMYDLGNFTKP